MFWFLCKFFDCVGGMDEVFGYEVCVLCRLVDYYYG